MNNSTVYSALISLNYYKGFSVFRSMNIEESANIICNMAYKINKSENEGRKGYIQTQPSQTPQEIVNEENKESNKELSMDTTTETSNCGEMINYCSVLKKVKKENITPENIGEIMLSQIPGISSVTAIAIMNNFKNMNTLISKLKEDNDCLNQITYTNSNSQKRKISKTAILNIIKFLQIN